MTMTIRRGAAALAAVRAAGAVAVVAQADNKHVSEALNMPRTRWRTASRAMPMLWRSMRKRR